MDLTETEKEDLIKLEEALWKSETRFNLSFQEKVFASDFFEFGRSGRRYTREQMVRTESQPIRAKFPLKNLKIHPLDSNNVLVTYISEVQYDELELANRCSVWSRKKDGWQLRFHQGTPTADENVRKSSSTNG
ncbi:MAG: DUF4440 domain-containing protein [Bdellovibrionales bacterium]|nr:DUF4440 domain-containing protein [Bdellovibrionales bacterium]